MLQEVHQSTEEVKNFQSASAEEIEKFRIKYLGSKGLIKQYFEAFKSVANEEKKAFGLALNELKNLAQKKHEDLLFQIKSAVTYSDPIDDLTKPGIPVNLGSRHPLSIMRRDVIRIFEKIGFSVADGPEIEDDWHNFSALNFPPEHPARDMQDTFFITEDWALRTHTSSVQVRVMENEKPPIRKLMPGRVFRNEAISARAHCIFHQIEGLYIDEGVSFADMKQTLYYFATELFGKETKIRFRPSYFPFTEPSAEVDIYWGLKNETDYRITKGTGWLEIMGCGMVDPNVLENCGIDSKKYSGYAFGMGLERMTLHRHSINDLRLFFENDIRFLKNFTATL